MTKWVLWDSDLATQASAGVPMNRSDSGGDGGGGGEVLTPFYHP